jgi:hypothetical protein
MRGKNIAKGGKGRSEIFGLQPGFFSRRRCGGEWTKFAGQSEGKLWGKLRIY